MRFVVLQHFLVGECHFDWLFESPSTDLLTTWQTEIWPLGLGETPCRRLPDHRRIYLTYEGPVLLNRGRVQRIEAGTYTAVSATEARFVAALHGQIHQVVVFERTTIETWTLRRTSPG